MTLDEAIDKKIERVRTEPWNKYAHVILPDFHGPWAKVLDPCSNVGMGESVNHTIAIIMLNLPGKICFPPNQDVWEEWKMPDDYVERFGQPPTYKETWK